MDEFMPSNVPAGDSLHRDEEARRLRQLWGALGLVTAVLWAGLLWFALSLAAPRQWWGGGGRGASQVSLEDIARLSLTAAWCAAVVGLWARAGSVRWRRHALWLVALGAVDFGLVLAELVGGLPGHVRLLQVMGDSTTWVEFWLTAVVLAEVGIAAEDEALIRRTERIGPAVLFGGVAWAGLLGFFDVAKDELVLKNTDGSPSGLAEMLVLANLVLLPVCLYMLARAATRATGLIGRQVRALEAAE